MLASATKIIEQMTFDGRDADYTRLSGIRTESLIAMPSVICMFQLFRASLSVTSAEKPFLDFFLSIYLCILSL